MEHFAHGCGGDVRSALNALELAVLSTKESADGEIHITLETAEECLQKKAFLTIKMVTRIMMYCPLFKNRSAFDANAASSLFG